jgi:uncharacterized protein (TIGR03086 family)
MTLVVKFMSEASRMTENQDPRPLYRRAVAQTETLVAAVSPSQLSLPTPCPEYDARALLAHIVGGLTRTALVGEGDPEALTRPAAALLSPGGTTPPSPPAAYGPPDDGWPDAYSAAADRAFAAWADDAKLDTLVEVPWGKVPGRFALAGYIQEVLTHGWDLAKATSQPTEGDPELALWALATAKRILPPEIRGAADVPFGPVIEPPADAGPYTQLAAWLGRHP